MKVATLAIERDPAFIYVVRRGGVWRVPRDPGQRGRHPWQEVARGVPSPDPAWVYYLDRDGDLARSRRPAP